MSTIPCCSGVRPIVMPAFHTRIALGLSEESLDAVLGAADRMRQLEALLTPAE